MTKTATGAIQTAAIAAFILCGTVGPGSAAEQAVTNKQVAKHLAEARKLAGSKQWDAALTALEKTQQVPGRSPYAEYKISEFKGYVLTQQRKYGRRLASSNNSANPIRPRRVIVPSI